MKSDLQLTLGRTPYMHPKMLVVELTNKNILSGSGFPAEEEVELENLEDGGILAEENW